MLWILLCPLLPYQQTHFDCTALQTNRPTAVTLLLEAERATLWSQKWFGILPETDWKTNEIQTKIGGILCDYNEKRELILGYAVPAITIINNVAGGHKILVVVCNQPRQRNTRRSHYNTPPQHNERFPVHISPPRRYQPPSCCYFQQLAFCLESIWNDLCFELCEVESLLF